MEQHNSWLVFASMFVIASLAGLASLLRSSKSLSIRSILSAMLNSGLLGLAIGLTWCEFDNPNNTWFVAGISLLAGLGGMTVVEFIIAIFRHGGLVVSVNVSPDQGVNDESTSDK